VNPIFIALNSVNIIMPHMLNILCTYDLLMANIEGYLLKSNLNGKITLTHTFIYLLEA